MKNLSVILYWGKCVPLPSELPKKIKFVDLWPDYNSPVDWDCFHIGFNNELNKSY